VLTATVLVAAALVTGTVVSAWQAVRATRAEALVNEWLRGEQHQRALAQKNAADADARRRDAIANLHQAREAVDQMLTRVSEEKLFNTPQMELIRKAILEDALSYYQRFLRQAGSDPAVRLGTGEAYRRTGQIYRQLGHPDQAEPACREAIALLETLVAESPADPANRLALARSCHELGQALSRLGRYPESESALRRATGVMQGLIADFPRHDGYPRIKATMDADLAWVSERLVWVAEQHKSEEFYREDLRSKEKLLAAAPNDPHRRQAVAYAQLKLGRSLLSGRPQEAERLTRDAIAGALKLTGEFPHTAEVRTNLADAYHQLFLLLRAGRRFEEAEAVYRESLPNLETLIAQAPTLPYPRRLLVEHYWDYALMLEDAGRPHDADEALRRAITAVEAMRAEFPTYAWAPSRLACVYNHIGGNHRAAGRLSQAEAAYRKALDVSETAARALPHTELRCRLADACFHLGLLLMRGERHEEANGVFRKLFEPELVSADACNYVARRFVTDTNLHLHPPGLAVELARKAVSLAPGEGAVWNTLGVAQFRAGNWRESINALQKSKALRNGGDSFDWFVLAMAHWRLGNKDEARRSYDRGAAWMDKNKPDDEELRHFRAEAADLLGMEQRKD
jgi:tetratricopeptide (TPR) repeat protein